MRAPADAAVRAVADVAGVAALGLAVLLVLDEPRHRPELRRAAERPLAVAAVVWLVAEAMRLTLAAAAAADVGATKLSLHTALDFAGTAGGRAIPVTLTAAALTVRHRAQWARLLPGLSRWR